MFKRFSILGVLAAAAAMLAAPAQAHYVYTFSGWVYHSVQCDLTLRSVQSDNQRVAVIACSLVPTKVEVLCKNPEGKIKPGQAYYKGSVVLTEDITDGEVDSNGKFSTSLIFNTNVAPSALTVECLRNWTAYTNPDGTIPIFVREFDSELRTYVCEYKSDPTGQCSLPAFNEVDGSAAGAFFIPSKVIAKKCTISKEYSLTNPPAQGTPFTCASVQTQHLD